MASDKMKLEPETFVSPGWFKDKSNSWIWIRGYRMMRVPSEHLANGVKVVDLGSVRAIFLRGTFPYIDSPPPPKTAPEGAIPLGGISVETAPVDTYLLLTAPHVVDGVPRNTQQARAEITSAAGFLRLVNGPNITYSHIFDNTCRADGVGASAAGKSGLNAYNLPPTDLSPASLKLLQDAASGLASLSEADRSRVLLSLRWFVKDAGTGGTDEFISRWIALETLAMPTTTKIRPANDLLARIYGISSKQAANKFLLGRICELRARIVHKGATPAISARILDYLAALYRDLFFGTIGIASPHAAELALNESGPDILEALAKARTTAPHG